MAKKKRSTKGSGSGGDDAASSTSTSTLASLRELSAGVAEEEEVVDPFERCLEALYEKRASTRVAALAGLVALMEKSYCYEDCLYRQETITRMQLGCLRRGAANEASLATRALGLHLLTLGPGAETEQMMLDVSLALQKVATAGGKDAGLRSLALEVLSLLTFAGEEDQSECDRIMRGFLALADIAGSPKVGCAALRGWSLLLSSLPPWRLNSTFCDAALQSLSPHLSTNDVELRDAAGEAIALLFSMADLSHLEEAEEAEYEKGAETSGLDDVVNRIKALAANRGDTHRRSKKDRSYLKSTFREHLNAIEGREVSLEKVKMRDGRRIVIDALEGQIQLNAFRHFFGTGLQAHLEANPLLHDVFGLYDRDNGAIHQLIDMGYKASHTPSTATLKTRSRERCKEQAQKAHYSGAVLGALGSEDVDDL